MKGGEWNKKTDVELFQLIHLLFNKEYYKLKLSSSSKDDVVTTANSIFDAKETSLASCKKIPERTKKTIESFTFAEED